MKIFFFALLLLSATFSQDASATSLSGRYQTSKKNGVVIDLPKNECLAPEYEWSDESEMCIEPFESTDELGLFENENGNLSFAFMLLFFNGHTCSMAGEAQKNQDHWTYKDHDDPQCVLHIKREGDIIILKDDYSCKYYCGMRGSIDGAQFPLSSRQGDITKDELSCLAVHEECPDKQEKQ